MRFRTGRVRCAHRGEQGASPFVPFRLVDERLGWKRRRPPSESVWNVEALSDRQLVFAALDGDPSAREQPFRRHWRMAWKRAHSITGRPDLADDATQDVFERAFRSLASFDGTRGEFGAWIGRIAINRALDLMRAERRTAPIDAAAEIPTWDVARGGDPEVTSALKALDPDRRAVLVLRYWLDMTGAQIAEVLELPIGTVNSRMARGLADLRAIMGADT